MTHRLNGKIALVTGGAQGIGEGVCLLLAEKGAAVGVVHRPGDAGRERALNVVRAVEAVGGRAMALAADVADYASISAAAKALGDAYGGIDIVVTSAGVSKRLPALKDSEPLWSEVITVNLTGTYNTVQACLPFLLRAGGGKIVTISSQQYITGKGFPAYVASKAGVVGLTKSLAIELGPLGINVNCVAPGATDTPMHRAAMVDREAYIQQLPLRRIGTPKDIAEAVFFLASEAGSYFAGQVLSPNGGRSM